MAITQKDIAELEEASLLEGTELGELWELLCRLTSYRDYASEDFIVALDNEIATQLENVRANTRIVIEEQTITHRITKLEWLE